MLTHHDNRPYEVAAAEAATDARAKLVEREKAEREARKTAWRETLRQYALAIDTLARAATDGYDVAAATEEAICERAAKVLGGRFAKVDECEERAAPSTASLAVRDRVIAGVAALRDEIPSAVITEIEVGRVSRLNEWVVCCEDTDDRCGECDRDGEIRQSSTVVPVTLRWGDGDTSTLYVDAEAK